MGVTGTGGSRDQRRAKETRVKAANKVESERDVGLTEKGSGGEGGWWGRGGEGMDKPRACCG